LLDVVRVLLANIVVIRQDNDLASTSKTLRVFSSPLTSPATRCRNAELH
jgi:hypothetical protein